MAKRSPPPPKPPARTREPAPTATTTAPRHLLGLQGLSAHELRSILTHAREIADTPPTSPTLTTKTIANLFLEDSTRTRVSFSTAAIRLGARVVDLLGQTSSLNKGESLVDTVLNIQAMGVDAIILRARQSGSAALAARHLRIPLINAGDGRHEHPTQGLLDALTIARALRRDHAFDFSGLHVLIVGDVASSRVARSNIACLTTLGSRVTLVGPPALAPKSLASLGCEVHHHLDPLLPAADALIMLRVQFERHGETPSDARRTAIASIREYRHAYALTADRLRRLKPSTPILHPGPINRGIEMDSDSADAPASAILNQVALGVSLRMAVLERALA